MFFLDEPSMAEGFEAWCRNFDIDVQTDIAEGLNYLVKRSIYDGQNVRQLTNNSADVIKRILQDWKNEWVRLKRRGGPSDCWSRRK